MTAKHEDLDLSDAEDRTIYRLRVGQEFANMGLPHVKTEAANMTGKGVSAFRHRVDATNAIANARIAALTDDLPGWGDVLAVMAEQRAIG